MGNREGLAGVTRKYFIDKRYLKVAGFFLFVAAMIVVIPRIDMGIPDTETADRATECERLSKDRNPDRLMEEKERCAEEFEEYRGDFQRRP